MEQWLGVESVEICCLRTILKGFLGTLCCSSKRTWSNTINYILLPQIVNICQFRQTWKPKHCQLALSSQSLQRFGFCQTQKLRHDTNDVIFHQNFFRHYMAEILPIRRKNTAHSIIQSKLLLYTIRYVCWSIDFYHLEVTILVAGFL